ncbi:hypothetical protein CTI14_72125, partial [Methylobacterium radiotolerans]
HQHPDEGHQPQQTRRGLRHSRRARGRQRRSGHLSVPTSTQTKATNLSKRAEGYGIPGVRVDGNDVLAT